MKAEPTIFENVYLTYPDSTWFLVKAGHSKT